jgi:sec-independent protein translocase protein TatA
MGNIGAPELVVLLIVLLVLFGPKRLPEMGRSLGKGLREFKDTLSGIDHEPEEAGPTSTRPRALNAVREHDSA